MDKLTDSIEEKLETPFTCSERIQMLNLAPTSSNRKKVSPELSVNEYTSL